MSPSDAARAGSASKQPIDWRAWVALAWVVWFGLLYGRMVIEQRGGKLRSWLRPAAVRGLSTR